jgi:hypothetical protein
MAHWIVHMYHKIEDSILSTIRHSLPRKWRGYLFQTRHPAVCIRIDRVHSILINYFVLVINSRAMGSISTNHGDGHIGINSMKGWLMDRLAMNNIMREIIFDSENVYWTICLIRCQAEQYSGSWVGPLFPGSCLGVPPIPRQPRPQCRSIQSVGRIFWRTLCNDLHRSRDCRVRNAGSQSIRATICVRKGWSHIKYDRKGNTATIFHHMIVCSYVATKT